MARGRDDARQVSYKGLLLGAVIVLVLSSAYGIYRTVKIIHRPVTYEEVMMCSECGDIFVGTYQQGESSPFTCEKCGKKSAYTAYICLDCLTRFPHKYPKSGALIECPHCMSTNVRQLTSVPAPIEEPEEPE